jgi:hypothetical protein
MIPNSNLEESPTNPGALLSELPPRNTQRQIQLEIITSLRQKKNGRNNFLVRQNDPTTMAHQNDLMTEEVKLDSEESSPSPIHRDILSMMKVFDHRSNIKKALKEISLI